MEIKNGIWSSNGVLDMDAFDKSIVLPETVITASRLFSISDNTITLLKHFESAHDGDKVKVLLQPEMDPVGIWTVGYGHVLTDQKGRMLRGAADKSAAQSHYLGNLTEQEASDLLRDDITRTYLPAVLKMIKRRDFNKDQWGALVMFAYNCGTHYKNSKGQLVPFALWANIDSGMIATKLYAYWSSSVTKSGGKVLSGLVRRRKAEAFLYCKNQVNFNPPDSI